MNAAFLVLMTIGASPAGTGAERGADPQPVEVERTDDRAIALGRKIRCPVCQGMPISESPSTSAQDMMAQVRRLVAEGKSDEEVIAWFTARYGEWAILEPSREGFNLLVWILPGIALLGGLVLVLLRVRRGSSKTNDPDPRADSIKKGSTDEDPYLKALRDEVNA